MIFVTGDTHCFNDVEKLDRMHFPMQDKLTKDDYMIIAGDFGGVWFGDEQDERALSFYEELPFTILFVAGNHENHRALSRYPVEEWNGGSIHRIRDHVIHLMDGNVFTIEDKTIFVMGGATSVDKAYRKEGESWWPEEEPSEETLEFAMENLARYDNEVDYIITHTCPEIIKTEFLFKSEFYKEYESRVEQFLDIVLDNVRCKKWYLGHIHIDLDIREFNMKIIFNDIERLR